MVRRRRKSQKREQAEETIEEAEELARSAQEQGVREAVDDYIGEKIRETTQKAAIKRFGNHPALILLPEFIEAQKGYSPRVYEDTSGELRRELGLEEEPTLEEAEQIFEESELLENLIDEELQEVENILEQLDETELEDIAQELEEEIPEEGETETDEYIKDEEEPEKCYSISLGFGDEKNTFNTCDQTEYPPDDSFDGIDEEGSPDYDMPSIPPNGFWCPVIRQMEAWDNIYFYVPTGASFWDIGMIGFRRQRTIIDWIPSNTGDYRDWVQAKIDENYFSNRTPAGLTHTAIFNQSGVTGDGYWDGFPPYYVSDGEIRGRIAEPPLPGYAIRIIYPPWPWYTNTGREDPEDRIYCRSAPVKPLTENRRRPPRPIREKKRGNRDMREQCCKATLSLLRKVSYVTGTANESLYPLPTLAGGRPALLRHIVEVIMQASSGGSDSAPPEDSELVKKIALNLGVPVDNVNVDEQYPDGVRKQSHPENYGFPFKVPRNWLEPDNTGEITVHNSKQLQFILGSLVAQNNQVLRPHELLTEGVQYPNALIAPRGKGYSKASNYLQLFEALIKMLDHLGIHPCEPT